VMDDKDRLLLEMIEIELTTLEPYLTGIWQRNIADIKETIKARLTEEDEA